MSHKPSFLFAQCQFCSEANPSALTRHKNTFICGNCKASRSGRKQKRCPRCGRFAPYEKHHVYGRQISDETEDLCVNCHRIVHVIGRMEQIGERNHDS